MTDIIETLTLYFVFNAAKRGACREISSSTNIVPFIIISISVT